MTIDTTISIGLPALCSAPSTSIKHRGYFSRYIAELVGTKIGVIPVSYTPFSSHILSTRSTHGKRGRCSRNLRKTFAYLLGRPSRKAHHSRLDYHARTDPLAGKHPTRSNLTGSLLLFYFPLFLLPAGQRPHELLTDIRSNHGSTQSSKKPGTPHELPAQNSSKCVPECFSFMAFWSFGYGRENALACQFRQRNEA